MTRARVVKAPRPDRNARRRAFLARRRLRRMLAKRGAKAPDRAVLALCEAWS